MSSSSRAMIREAHASAKILASMPDEPSTSCLPAVLSSADACASSIVVQLLPEVVFISSAIRSLEIRSASCALIACESSSAPSWCSTLRAVGWLVGEVDSTVGASLDLAPLFDKAAADQLPLVVVLVLPPSDPFSALLSLISWSSRLAGFSPVHLVVADPALLMRSSSPPPDSASAWPGGKFAWMSLQSSPFRGLVYWGGAASCLLLVPLPLPDPNPLAFIDEDFGGVFDFSSPFHFDWDLLVWPGHLSDGMNRSMIAHVLGASGFPFDVAAAWSACQMAGPLRQVAFLRAPGQPIKVMVGTVD